LGIPHIDPCDLLFNPIVKKGCDATVGNIHVSVPVLPTPTNIAADVVNTVVPGIVDQFMSMIATWVANGLKAMLAWINHSTVPDITQSWALKMGGITLGYAIIIAIAAFNARNVKAAANQDVGEMGKGFLSIGLFVALAPTVPFLVTWIVNICDNQIAGGLIDQFGTDMQKVMVQLSTTLSSQGDWTNAGGATLLLGLFGVLGTALLAVEFFLRMAAIYLYTFWVILCMGMAVFGGWQLERLKQAVLGLLGLCLFKVFAVLIMIIGVMLLGDPSHDAEAIIYGSVILLMVPVFTWWMYKKFSGHEMSPAKVYYGAKGVVQAGAGLFTSS
jgi:hypothetical protein